MKKRFVVRMICLFLCLPFLFSVLMLSTGAEQPTTPDLRSAKAVLLYHLESDSAVLSSNENALLPAASTVKVLSGMLLCEQLRDRLSESILITSDMLSGAYRKQPILGLAEGDVLSVEELLYAAICGGYNDAFYVLANVAMQSTDAFVALMNQRARELGAEKSLFTDPTEASDSSFTTALELAKIASAAHQNELYMQICGSKSYTIDSLSKSITNVNEMIGARNTNRHYNSKCNGMSAGWSTGGGDCIVASLSNGTASYVCVILGCTLSKTEEDNQAYSLANILSYWVYETYRNIEIITPDTVVCKIPVTVSDMTTEVEARTDRALTAFLPATVEVGKEITYSIRLSQTELEAPVKEGTFVGYVAILYRGEIIETAPLYTAGSAERSSFISSLESIKDLFESRRVVSGLIFFLVALVGWITVELLLIRHRHRRWNKYFSKKVDTTKRH